ncbi:L,D-transpeptidase [Roseibium sp. DSM 29163]|uniref:L,D-transpeptidase n=1 Tax=Roseibium salinum TaxID=1604349 RepID=A0ABT3R4Z5_9HYPH|nr:L,D-transpeptidase [Roseibium sp. DSM 29163]MCX2724087.1 L,D-transpeptidase [Roseibium sp. DSM 29163]
MAITAVFVVLALGPDLPWQLPAQAESVLVFDPARNAWVRKEGEKVRPGFGVYGKSPVEREVVAIDGSYRAGTIIIDTAERRLYRVEGDGKATRYGIGVGREGFAWKGKETISRKAEWPSWTPPAEMRQREAARGVTLPARMEGGIENPLGARALYLGNTLYRIHGTNQPWTIGQAVSSGCIRLTNEDVVHLYSNVRVGDLVIVR